MILLIITSTLVQAVRVEIERVCALLEEITIFCPDDQSHVQFRSGYSAVNSDTINT